MVGSFDAVSVVLDKITHNIWCMKDPDFVMSLMATQGALSMERNQENLNGLQTRVDGKFECAQPLSGILHTTIL